MKTLMVHCSMLPSVSFFLYYLLFSGYKTYSSEQVEIHVLIRDSEVYHEFG